MLKLETLLDERFAEFLATDGNVCEECDLTIHCLRDLNAYAKESPVKCERANPFCTNHTYKVDWRARARKAERDFQEAIYLAKYFATLTRGELTKDGHRLHRVPTTTEQILLDHLIAVSEGRDV